MAYIKSDKNQNWLLPLSIKDMIPKDHICFLVENFVDLLDYSNFDMIYDGAGHPAYHPRIIIKTLIYGMLCKTRSSRKLARATRENFVFMYLAEFLLRGLEKVKIELNLVCIAHNLQKIWRLRAANGC